mgnify:CR=1 FL=1|tara:strand:- start:5154 stop:5588 length:435 start_codon:yes stop_codon:yes gene_type:complete
MAAGNSDSREVIDLTVELESLEERQARRSANRLAASESRARKHVMIDLTSEEAVECAVQPALKPRRSSRLAARGRSQEIASKAKEVALQLRLRLAPLSRKRIYASAKLVDGQIIKNLATWHSIMESFFLEDQPENIPDPRGGRP